MADLYLALTHFPVLDKNGATATSSVTTLDVHDLGRTTRTYGLAGYYIVTPLEQMQHLVRQMIGYWEHGPGQAWKPTRHQALERIGLTRTLAECLADVTHRSGQRPRVVASSARPAAECVDWSTARTWLETPGAPVVLLLGTAYGLAPAALALAEYRLPPVRPHSDYNHLTVRSAAAIMVDRLVGDDLWNRSGEATSKDEQGEGTTRRRAEEDNRKAREEHYASSNHQT